MRLHIDCGHAANSMVRQQNLSQAAANISYRQPTRSHPHEGSARRRGTGDNGGTIGAHNRASFNGGTGAPGSTGEGRKGGEGRKVAAARAQRALAEPAARAQQARARRDPMANSGSASGKRGTGGDGAPGQPADHEFRSRYAISRRNSWRNVRCDVDHVSYEFVNRSDRAVVTPR